jgi:CRP-like cAMP-binding protein
MSTPAGEVLTQLFPQLSADSVANLEREARLEQHAPQVTLCREGEVEDSFYIIINGRVDVYKLLEGQMLFINYLTAGAHFGDIALLLDVPRTATIITSEPTRVLRLDRTALNRFIERYPAIVVALSQLIIKRFLAHEEKQLMEIARLKKRDVPPPQIFVCYSRADQEFVTQLVNNLRKHRLDVWLDIYRLEAGKSWARQIGHALDVCQIMLLILSPTSVASDNAEDEWNYYLDMKKPVLVVRHIPCKVPYRLSKLNYIDFHEADYDQALARLVATLNTME